MATNAADMLQRDGMGKLRTVLAKYRDQAAKKNSGGGKSRISMADVLKEAGMSPTDFYTVPSMEGRLSGELLQEYDTALKSILNASYVDGVRNTKSVGDSIADLIEYQEDALQELARNFQTLNDPNASAQDKAKARMSVDQLSTRDLGDKHDKNSPLAGYKEKGAAYFSEDVRFENLTPEQKAQYLDDPEQLDASDYAVSEKLDQRGRTFREDVQGIDYNDLPTRERAYVEDIDQRTVGQDELLSQLGLERTVGQDELVDPTIANEIQSKWQDQGFVEGIDRTGESAMRSSLDYFDQLIANDGRDAVSDAYMNRMTNEAERLRKANVDAALANLDARGMAGSGMELQAYLQGAGQSMQAQFDAAMEAAAMAQQRKDAAAEQRAVQGQAMQLMQNGQARDMAQAIDMATQQRAEMKWGTAQQNAQTQTAAADKTFDWRTDAATRDADKYTSAADQNFQWAGQQASQNANLWDSAAGDQFGAASSEVQARNRNLEGVENKIFATGAGGVLQDAATAERVDTGNRAVTEAGKLAAVGQGNTAADLEMRAKQLQAMLEGQDPNGWDIAAGVIDALQGGSEAAVNLSKLGGK